MGWVGNDAAKDFYERYGGTWHFLAKVRPRRDEFVATLIGVGEVGEYATQEEAQVAAVGFIKLLKE
jgi:hypothetical protein